MSYNNVTPTKKNYILAAARLLTGLLFVFSGLIKANDPVGFGYKLQEYFLVFNLDVLNPYTTGIAIFICGLEIIFGVLLLVGIYPIMVSWGLLLMILFFTFLTFYSAFFEVVTSCGCFGDAIPLTPWESFGKDLVLLLFILVIFYYRRQIKPLFKESFNQGLVLISTVVISMAIGIYTANYLPFVDFLPYKKGANIPALMSLPAGAQLDEFAYEYKLKNTVSGEEKSVSDKVYLSEKIWEDSTWAIQGEPTSRLVKAGYKIPISDLLIFDEAGTDYTKELIENPYYNFIIVAQDLNQVQVKELLKINDITAKIATDYNLRAVLLTSSSAQDAGFLSDQLGLIFEIFYADAVPLKSMVRANPGIILMKDGVIINKWHYHNFPSLTELEKKYFNKDK
ncbi:DoxX family protein [Sphingobacteriaceae bacterium WQ 2009]|uniref:DoxX family protein n=1 Tax=Rhinopithecimicrobium faecis TaxID=2820698 RepID=A0A8T4HET1_9SPHI|nr:DoxX family protein [Sphingobacteriaceae bacterium WQ 2009]